MSQNKPRIYMLFGFQPPWFQLTMQEHHNAYLGARNPWKEAQPMAKRKNKTRVDLKKERVKRVKPVKADKKKGR